MNRHRINAPRIRRIIETLDVQALRSVWRILRPGERPPKDDAEVLMVCHAARVMSRRTAPALRRESHRFMTDRGVEPPVPIEFLGEPPRLVGTTGIAVNASHPEVVERIHGAMHDALLDSESLGDPAAVTRERMQAARHRERRGLGLRRLYPD